MAGQYITKQGQTLDLACRAHYGTTRTVTETVLAANPGLAAKGPLLPIGTVINMPDIDLTRTARDLVKLWD
jgi:phage tail protein X